MTKKKKPYNPPLTTEKQIKLHIKCRNELIIQCLKEENKCNHQWMKVKRGFKCENCDYYTGMDARLNQLINKLKK